MAIVCFIQFSRSNITYEKSKTQAGTNDCGDCSPRYANDGSMTEMIMTMIVVVWILGWNCGDEFAKQSGEFNLKHKLFTILE